MAKRVLVVDDAMIMRMRIKDIAQESGWEIAGEATNGEDAVVRFQELRPDLTTLDIVMPRMDGVSALRTIRQADPRARVVMVSAVDQKEKLTECIRLGAIDFIVKPFDKASLKGFFEKMGRETATVTAGLAPASAPPVPTLFDKLGGKAAIDAAVEIFYQRVLADERIKHFFATTDMPAQISKQKKFLAFAFGAPTKYEGRSLREAHQQMPLDERHFAAVAENLQATLQQLNVAAELIDQALAIAAGTINDVLNR